MKRNLHKYLASSLGLSLLAVSAHAIPKAPCDQKQSDVCCENPKPGPFAFQYSRDLKIACEKGFYVAADFIAMQAKQDGLDYAMINTTGGENANTIGTSSLNSGEVQGFSSNDNDWDWGLGFRVNFGFISNHDDWNFDGEYTYFHYTEDTSSTVKGSGRILPFWLAPALIPASNNPPQEASAQWIMHYNTLDLSLGKPHHISRHLTTNPFFGLRLGWIDQHYLARYGGTYRQSTGSVFPSQEGAEMNAENDFHSVGLRAGLKTSWLLGAGFEIIGNVAASILYTHFDVSQDAPLLGNSYEIDHDFYHNIPNFEVMMGLGYSTLFNKNKHRISLRLVYEFHEWWNVNQLRRFADDINWSANYTVSRGNLTLNGLSFRIGFDF